VPLPVQLDVVAQRAVEVGRQVRDAQDRAGGDEITGFGLSLSAGESVWDPTMRTPWSGRQPSGTRQAMTAPSRTTY
jgi:hypothetical protein